MQEEEMKQVVDIAYRAKGFAEKLHQEGSIRRGDIVKDTTKHILSFETEHYPEFVRASILETAEVLKRMLDNQHFDSGERKYYPIKDRRERI